MKRYLLLLNWNIILMHINLATRKTTCILTPHFQKQIRSETEKNVNYTERRHVVMMTELTKTSGTPEKNPEIHFFALEFILVAGQGDLDYFKNR